MDLDLRELEKQARSSQSEADLSKLQTARERHGIGAADADYLKKYLEICDSFLNGGCELRFAQKKLADLNEEYRYLVLRGTLRHEIMGDSYAYDDGWVASAIC